MDQPTTTPWSDTQKLIALFIVSAFIAVIGVWIFFPPKADTGSLAVLNTMTGALGTMTMTVIGFYFGSSRDSRNKDATIAASAPPTVAAAPVTNGNGHSAATPAG